MKLTKETQYALLFTLYLCRSGRTTVDEIATELKLSVTFLKSIAVRLKTKNVVLSFRGPTGGYELAHDLTVGDVYWAINDVSVLPGADIEGYGRGDADQRAFALLARGMQGALVSIMKRRLKNVSLELAANELGTLNKLTEASSQH